LGALTAPSVQSSARPILRFGSVCDDKVCRVPKLTSFSTVAFIRSGETSAAIAATFWSGPGAGAAIAVDPSRPISNKERID